MRLQIRPNGPLLLAKAWAAGRSCPWAPRPARGPIIPDDRSGQERAASLSFLRLMRLPGLFRRIGGGPAWAARSAPCGLGLGWALRFSAALFAASRRSSPFPHHARRLREAPIGSAPCLPLFPHPQSRRAKKAGRKRGKEEKRGKTGIKAAEGLREPRKEWRRRQSGGHKKSPEKSGLAGEGGAVDRDRPPAA